MAEQQAERTGISPSQDLQCTATCDLLKMTERQAALKQAGPTYLVVRFSVDETVCIVPRKKIVSPAIPSVGDSSEVRWSNGEILTATVLATGDLTSMRKAETTILNELENDTAEEADDEEGEPAKKKKRVDKENVVTSNVSRKGKRKRKPLKEMQVKKLASKKKDNGKFTFELGAPAKGLSPPSLPSTLTVANQPLQSTPVSASNSCQLFPLDTSKSVTESPLSSVFSLSDNGVLPHPSPKNNIHISIDTTPPSTSSKLNDKTTSQLESFTKMISSTFQLFDTRLVNITSKLNEVSKRQEEMEVSMKLLHESVRKISVPAPQPPLVANLPKSVRKMSVPAPQPPPAAPATEYGELNCNTPAFFRSEEEPWWCSNSILGDETIVSPSPAAHPPQNNITSGDFLSAKDVLKIRACCATRRNFATCVMRTIFDKDVRKTSNVNGVKKLQLDPDKIAFVRRVAFNQFPVRGDESEQKAWSSCVEAIDEANRRLNRRK